MNTNTVEIELATGTLVTIAAEAARTGRTVDEVIVENLAKSIGKLNDEDITVQLRFTKTEWHTLEGKAKLAGCSALALLTSSRDILVDTDELVPVWVPQGIVNKLWQAVESVQGDADRIAEIVLGNLLTDTAGLADLIAENWPSVAAA